MLESDVVDGFDLYVTINQRLLISGCYNYRTHYDLLGLGPVMTVDGESTPHLHTKKSHKSQQDVFEISLAQALINL